MMTNQLATRDEIRLIAEELASYLKNGYKDKTGSDWTENNFQLLSGFCEKHLDLDSKVDCFHRKHPEGKEEFLWDFLAVQKNRGVLLVAESEQETYGEIAERNLKHDFEKLLYVFAPLRLLICKSSDEGYRDKLVGELADYANGCCLKFNPGAVFLLHFGMWGGAQNGSHESHTYIWQSEGDPSPLNSNRIEFAPM